MGIFEDSEKESVYIVRGQVSNYNLDDHGFEYFKLASKMTPIDFSSREMIEEIYLLELEEKLKLELDNVDKVYIYDWRKKRTGDHPLHNKKANWL